MDRQTVPIGKITATIINIGNVQEDLNPWFKPSAADRAAYPGLFDKPAQLPIYSTHLATPTASVMVDAGAYDYPPDSPLLIPGYTPPPDLLTSLRAAGIDPAGVDHVIITHAHGDHFNALTELTGDTWVPVFPNAQHYLGRGDWERIQPDLADPTSLQSRTLGVLHQRGQLQLVDAETEVVDGITILPAAGESPGHQVVRVHSEGETFYCLGDLYHHPLEVEQPAWMPPWNDGETNRRNRATLNEAFLREDARLLASHIAGVGKLTRRATGYTWQRL